MSDEENVAEAEPETTESVPVLDEDRDELMKDMTLEERQEALKRSRWNVFLYLGLAALMFGFALFPFPFAAEPVGNSYEQDLGFVWGAPLDGEDFTDVPIEIEVTATNPPANPDARIAVYLINSDDCTSNEILELKRDARVDPSHDNQFQLSSKAPIVDEVVTFEFNVDGGGQCLFAEYVDKDDTSDILIGGMDIDGSMWPNQIWAGIFAILFLSLSAFAFIGAQKHGAGVKALTEPGKKSTEEKFSNRRLVQQVHRHRRAQADPLKQVQVVLQKPLVQRAPQNLIRQKWLPMNQPLRLQTMDTSSVRCLMVVTIRPFTFKPKTVHTFRTNNERTKTASFLMRSPLSFLGDESST